MSDQYWVIDIHGVETGPHEFPQIIGMMATGQLIKDSLVKKAGSSSWGRIQDSFAPTVTPAPPAIQEFQYTRPTAPEADGRSITAPPPQSHPLAPESEAKASVPSSPGLDQGPGIITHPGLVGVRGWLWWLALMLTVAGPLRFVAGLNTTYEKYPTMFIKPYVGLTTLLLVLDSTPVLLGAIAGVKIFMNQRGAIRMARQAYYLVMVVCFVEILAISQIGPGLPNYNTSKAIEQAITLSFQAYLGAGIWLLYLHRSVRVRQTFPEG